MTPVDAQDAWPATSGPMAAQVPVQNLLDNALRHGSPGGGTINLSLRRTGRGLALCVEDSGLGLSIVKSIAELHGATVRLDRSPALGGLCAEVPFPCSG